ncbi:MAG: MFS transporter [Actinomycetota bacterium]|nr:MFS transporter [Actinomycetota bacterium]
MKGSAARARETLRSSDFRRLFAARIASQLGDGLFQAVIVAAVVFSPEKQSTTVGFARATAVLVVPYSVLGPFAGVFIDRWRRRRILVVTPLLRAAAALLLLPGAGAAVPFYAGALIVLSANRFFLVTAGTVTPKLVVFEDLLVANSLNSVGGTLATIVGVAAGGLMTDAFGAPPTIALTVLLWGLASLIASTIRTNLSAARRPEAALRRELARVAGELRDGTRRLWNTPRALGPITSYTVDQFLQGLILVISFVVFRDRFREGVGSFSFLIGASAVGGFAGMATVGWLESRLRKPAMVAVAFLVSGIPLLALSGFITRISVVVASFFLGLGFAWKKIPIDTMVQQAIPDAFRGRVFAVYDVAQNMARVVAALIAIAVVRSSTVGLDIAVAGAIMVAYAPVLPRWVRRSTSLEVRSYAGARADEQPRSVVMAGVEEPVEVERAWREERAGARLLCFQLRLPDGSRIEVSRPEDGEQWRLDRELPA